MRKAFVWASCICPACGGEWFRTADYYAWQTEATWNTIGKDSYIPMTLCVCLCGAPLPPEIGGIHGGRTPNLELTRFMASLAGASRHSIENRDFPLIQTAAEEQLVRKEAVRALEKRFAQLQLQVGRRMSAGRGRHWTLPASKTAAPSGTLTRAGLETKLQERGFTSRKSEMILETILDTMIQCLRGGKNVMVYPLGRFEVRTNPKTRRRRRLGKLQTLYRKPKKVVFRPSDRLRERLAADRGGNQKQGRRV